MKRRKIFIAVLLSFLLLVPVLIPFVPVGAQEPSHWDIDDWITNPEDFYIFNSTYARSNEVGIHYYPDTGSYGAEFGVPVWVNGSSDSEPLPYIYFRNEAKKCLVIRSGLIGVEIYDTGIAKFWDPDFIEERVKSEIWDIWRLDGKNWKKACLSSVVIFNVTQEVDHLIVEMELATSKPDGILTVHYIVFQGQALKHNVRWESASTSVETIQVKQVWDLKLLTSQVLLDGGTLLTTSAKTNSTIFLFGDADNDFLVQESQWSATYYPNETLRTERFLEADIDFSGKKVTFTFGNWTLAPGESLEIDPTTATIQPPTADAFVRQSLSGDNFGGLNTFYILSKDSNRNDRGFLKFSISELPDGAIISSAKLGLYVSTVYAYTAGVSDIEARRVADDSWTELGITWNNQKAFGALEDTVAPVNGWKEWDVLNFIQAEWAGDKIVSILLKCETESYDGTARGIAAYPKEYTDSAKWPKLVIDYAPPNAAPTITSATITGMHDGDNVLGMHADYYSLIAVVNDGDGATDIASVYIQVKQGGAVRFEVRGTSLDGVPSFSIQTGSTIIDIDSGSSSWGEAGDVGTLTVKFRAEWDYTDEADLEISVYVEDTAAASAGFTVMQTDYFDIIGRIVISNLAVDDGRMNLGGTATFSGDSNYADTVGGNNPSSEYPPDDQYTDIAIHDSGHVERGFDDVIVNGAFSVDVNIPDAVQSNTYHIYLDGVPDYTDADAPDGDTVVVIGDQIKILTLSANNTTPSLNEAVLLSATAELEFDNHVVGSGDSLSLEDLEFIWNGTSEKWEKVVVSAVSETRTYNEFTSGNEDTYTITVGDINGQTVSVTWGAAPSIVSATNPDMDNDDNWYAMRKFYTAVVVVSDTDGAVDIDKVYLQIKNATGVVGEFRATSLTGAPAWAIQTGATVFDLDAASCSWAENGDEGTATFKIRVEWDITQGDGMTLEVYVEDLGGGYASFTEMQTDYVDLINRLVTTDFSSNMTSARIDSPIQISGKVRYPTTTDGNVASLFYPPHEEFTSVTIENDEEEIESIDTTITNGVFNVTFNSHTLVRTTYYYAYLDLLDDYVDGFAPDGDYVIVTTSSNFYLSWLINQAFTFFGIGNYLSQIYEYGTALGTYFATSITNILQLIVQQFRIVLGTFSFFIDWYTRMVNMLFQIGTIIGGLIDGTGDVTSGLGNLWSYFSISTWIDVIPLFLFIWWVESIASRGRTQGEITVFLGDISTVMNITSWFLTMFGLVVNTMTDLAFRLMEIIT